MEPSPLSNVTSSRAFPRAFIIRPFGTKKIGETGPTIDFQRVEDELIRPAMERAEVLGATTEVYDRSGPIGRDMFQRLVTAQLVIADISIHNANVYYELGIRQALREKRTFLLRAKGMTNDVPFDLKTDRYLAYDPAAPGDTLAAFTAGLEATLAEERQDSPVFKMLPDLREHLSRHRVRLSRPRHRPELRLYPLQREALDPLADSP